MAEVATLSCNGHIPHPQTTENESNDDPFNISALPLPPPIDDSTLSNRDSTLSNHDSTPSNCDSIAHHKHDSVLPELPPLTIDGLSNKSDGTLNRMIISPLPPPVPIDTYGLEYGPVSESEPQLDSPPPSPRLDGEIPRSGFDGINQQYEFLRRTLSHSRTRYSARYKRPRPRPTSRETESSLDTPGKLGHPDHTSLDAPGRVRTPLSTTASSATPTQRHKHTTVRGVHPHRDLAARRPHHHGNRTSTPVTSGGSSELVSNNNYFSIIIS